MIRGLLVVAHPDDEVLWFGGLLLRTASRIKWTVQCCFTPRRDPERASKFLAACAALGANAMLREVVELFKHDSIEALLPEPSILAGYAVVATHGPTGEYGHRHHQQLHHWAKKFCAERLVWSAYGSSSLVEVRLTDAEWMAKRVALQCYDSQATHRGQRFQYKWEELLAVYGARVNLMIEPYNFDPTTGMQTILQLEG